MTARSSWIPLLVLALPLVVGAAGAQDALATSAGEEPRGASRHATASPAETVLVAARELRRGAVLREEDIQKLVVAAEEMPPSWNAAAATEHPAEPGWVIRRLIRQGEPLRAPAVAPPALVIVGADVTLVWQVGGLQVTRQGTAMGPGYLGDQVVVRVDATRRFTGTITGAATVLVGGPP